MSSVFTKIVNREIPAYIVHENEHFLAFLDINPLAWGHTLVIPKLEVDNIFDLDADMYAGLFLFAQKVAKAIEKNTTARKVGIAVIGLEVPHAHIHLVPINGVLDIDFSKPKLKFSAEELNEISTQIRKNIE